MNNRLVVGGLDGSLLPIVQDFSGLYYLKPDGTYYEPQLKDFWGTIPDGIVTMHDGSHATPIYYNGMLEIPYDCYCISHSEIKMTDQIKIVFKSERGDNEYFVIQFINEPQKQLLVGHAYTDHNLWSIIAANNTIGYSNDTMGHVHVCMYVDNQSYDCRELLLPEVIMPPVEPPVTPDQPDVNINIEINNLNIQIGKQNLIITDLQNQLQIEKQTSSSLVQTNNDLVAQLSDMGAKLSDSKASQLQAENSLQIMREKSANQSNELSVKDKVIIELKQGLLTSLSLSELLVESFKRITSKFQN